jgi:hypothetical protein
MGKLQQDAHDGIVEPLPSEVEAYSGETEKHEPAICAETMRWKPELFGAFQQNSGVSSQLRPLPTVI